MKNLNLKLGKHLFLVFFLLLAKVISAQQNGAQTIQSQVFHETFNGHQYTKIGSQWKYFLPNSTESFNVAMNKLSVKFNPGTSENTILAAETSLGLTRVKISGLGWYRYTFNPVGVNVFDKGRACLLLSYVDKVDIITNINYYQLPNDPQSSTSLHLQSSANAGIDLQGAWDIQTGAGSQILVSIIDSEFDIEHEDLGMGTDGYQNIYLNPGEDAWTNPNNPLSGNQLNEDGNYVGYTSVPMNDDWKGWNFYNNSNNVFLAGNPHGTFTAGLIAAKTNNNKGVSGVAGGWGNEGCKVLFCAIGPPPFNWVDNITDAIIYSTNMGANIINMSLGGGPSLEMNEAIIQASQNGITIIAASGNNNFSVVGSPANHPNVIAVGGSNELHQRSTGSNYGTHLDVVAPSVNIFSTFTNNNYGASGGTSVAAPIVSGVAALMLSENPCLGGRQVSDILTATADKVGGYYYNYQPTIPGKSNDLGYGRINAQKAVEAASQSYKPGIDLYMRDRFDDVGSNAGYQFTWDYDESPDIWVRNNPDGLEFANQFHEAQSFEFNPNDPFYVYVRIGNRGCTPSLGSEELTLYRSVAATVSGWPVDWDGTIPEGAIIGTQTIPILQPGESTILEFEWAPNFNIGHCLLARIENSPLDPIIVFPQDLAQDIHQNNNISMRNVFIHNIFPGITPPVIDDTKYPFGKFVYVGNVLNHEEHYDIILSSTENEPGKPFTSEAEVVLIFDQDGWNLMESYLVNRTDIRVLGDRKVQLLNPHVEITNVLFPSNHRIQLYVGYSFLSQELTEKNTFGYHIYQKYTEMHPTIGEHWTGAVHIYTTKYERDPFGAHAGDDRTIQYGEVTTLSANSISEAAVYNWYDMDGNLIYTGSSFSATPELTQKFKLEVIADLDGVKDYDEVEIKVNQFYIESISPNPANTTVNIGYKAIDANSAYLIIVGNSNSFSSNYILNCTLNETTIDVSGYPNGFYTVALVCDGEVRDAKQLIVE